MSTAMIESLSFCVIDLGCPEDVFARCIDSIERQEVPESEILVLGPARKRDGIRFIEGLDTASNICRARNLISSLASKEFICLMEPEVELGPDWYANIRGACLDIVGSRVLTVETKRSIDWALPVELGGEVFPYPLDYDEWSARAYIRASLIVMRKTAWEMVRFDERLGIDCGEDADFCLRATDLGFRTGVFPDASAVLHGAFPGVRRRHRTADAPYRAVKGFREAFSKGKEAYRRKSFEEAAGHFREAASIVPNDNDAWACAGWSEYFLGRYGTAIEYFSKGVRLQSRAHSPRRGLGWAYLQKKYYGGALKELKAALELTDMAEKDAWVEAVRGIGWAHYHLKDYDEAVSYFKKIIEETGPKGAAAAEAVKAIRLASKGREAPETLPSLLPDAGNAPSMIRSLVSSVKKRIKKGIKTGLGWIGSP
ncbi:MAG: tetratricopeptide repeat protein [Deltaproteobacteria bacterium]|nr:tetratricopeptide repeat protein [Deltaproteobacteria bacterium]